MTQIWKCTHSQTTTENEGNSCGNSIRGIDTDQFILLTNNPKQRKYLDKQWNYAMVILRF